MNFKLLIVGDPSGIHTMIALNKYQPHDIIVWEDQPTHVASIKAICEDVVVTDNLDLLSDMRFDVSLANPPYLKGIHIDFAIKLLEICDTVQIIHPASWLFRDTTKNEIKLKQLLKSRIKSLTIFNGHSKFTGAVFGVPLVITHAVKEHSGDITVTYETTGNTHTIKSLEDMPTGFWEPTQNNYDLVSKYYKLTEQSSIYDLLGNYSGSPSLSTPRVCGHVNLSTPRICGNRSHSGDRFVNDDYFTFFYRNSDIDTVNKNNKVYLIKSDSERDSLISYMKTKVARFGLAINKISQDAHISRYLKTVPLPPLDRVWTEDSIAEYYNFTPQEIEAINQFIPDYYGM